MIGDACWGGLVLLAVALEAVSRLAPRRLAGLGRVVADAGHHRIGRIVLLGVWLFVGLHLFARSTFHGG